MTEQIVLKAPDENTRGFFKFLKRLSVFSEVMANPTGHKPAEIDEAIEFLVAMAIQPKSPKKVRELLNEMSAKEIQDVLASFNPKANPDPLASVESEGG